MKSEQSSSDISSVEIGIISNSSVSSIGSDIPSLASLQHRPSFLETPSTVRESSPSDSNTTLTPNDQSLYSNPFYLLFLAFIFALVYSLIPSSNVWVDIFVRALWWNMCGVAAVVELLTVSIPDIPDWAYISSYTLGYLSTPCIQVIAVACGLQHNFFVSTISITSSAIIPVFIFLYFSFTAPAPEVPAASASALEVISDTEKPDTVIYRESRESGFMLAPFDTYSSCTTRQEYAALMSMQQADNSNSSSSSNRSNSRGPPVDEVDLFQKRGSRVEHLLQDEISPGRQRWLSIMKAQHQYQYQSASKVTMNTPSFATRARKNSLTVSVGSPPPSVADSIEGSTPDELAGGSRMELKWKDIFMSLFRFLPRYQFQEMVNYTPGYVCGDRRQQCLFAIVFITLYNGYYDSLCIFTSYFRSHRDPTVRVFLFFLYIVFGIAFRVALKRVGLLLDNRKRGTASMFFVGECMALLFYYTFYRVLFESVSNWGVFFGFQALHVVSEWVMYPLRASEATFAFSRRVEHVYPCVRGILVTTNTDSRDWLAFVALDFGLRVTMMICASLGMLFLLLVVDFVPWTQNDLKQSPVATANTCALIIISVALELCNAYLINLVFFRPNELSVFQKVRSCFQVRHFALLVTLIAANLFINPIFAFTRNNTV